MSENGSKASRDQVLQEIANAERFILVTHENPDGDALGSLVAMQEVLSALGKDSRDVHGRGRVPAALRVPLLRARRAGSVVRPTTPGAARSCSWTAATSTATRRDELKRDGAHILNLDHHHDNTRFGTVNHVVPEASCTAEIVWDLMRALGVEPTLPIAEALYVGLVTDTGKFMYENTGTRAHVMAAELIDAGVDVHEIYHRLYEGIPYGKLELLARGLANVERYDGGAADAHAPVRRGLPPDRRRGELLRGRHRPPALGRRHRGGGARARPPRIDEPGHAQGVAARLRRPRRRLADRARPGRRRPPPGRRLLDRAGWPELVAFLRAGARVSRQQPSHQASVSLPHREMWQETDAWLDGVILVDKPAGKTSHDVVAAVRAQPRRAPGRPRRDARSVRDRPAAGAGRAGHARAALPHGAAQDLRRRARLGAVSTTGDPEGEIAETGRVPDPSRAAAHRANPPAPAGLLGGQGRRASAPTGGRAAARRSRLPEREVIVHRFERVARGDRSLRDRVLARHLRALAHRRPRRRLLPGAAAHAHRAVQRGRRRPRPRRAAGRGARRSCPRCVWTPTRRRRAGHGQAVDRPRAGLTPNVVRLSTPTAWSPSPSPVRAACSSRS